MSPAKEKKSASSACGRVMSRSAVARFGFLSACVMLFESPFLDDQSVDEEELVMSTRDPKQTNRNADDVRGTNDTDDATSTNTRKDPDEWVTGSESMTGAQASYLKTLSEEAG